MENCFQDLYEWLVKPVALSDTPSTSMKVQSKPFDYIGKLVIVDFDVILIFNHN